VDRDKLGPADPRIAHGQVLVMETTTKRGANGRRGSCVHRGGWHTLPLMEATVVHRFHMQAILILRGHRVLLDSEIASLYGVTTKRLNEQVKRNSVRFPPDFMFRLTADEADSLRSPIATSNTLPTARGGRRSLPHAFTEHGAIPGSQRPE
jgi:hypothetical protein